MVYSTVKLFASIRVTTLHIYDQFMVHIFVLNMMTPRSKLQKVFCRFIFGFRHHVLNCYILTARHYAKRGICRCRVCVCVCVCVSVCVCLSHSGIVSKRLNVGSRK